MADSGMSRHSSGLVSRLKSRFEKIEPVHGQQPRNNNSGPNPAPASLTSGAFLHAAQSSSVPRSDGATETASSVIWRRAQDDLAHDKRWQEFKRQFTIQSKVLSIQEILAELQALKDLREDEQWAFGPGRRIKPRALLDKIIEYANNFKDAGAAIAGCDPTQHAGMAWQILQCLVTVCESFMHNSCTSSE
jgi:hypothetical protein